MQRIYNRRNTENFHAVASNLYASMHILSYGKFIENHNKLLTENTFMLLGKFSKILLDI